MKPGRPARSLVTIMTELTQLKVNCWSQNASNQTKMKMDGQHFAYAHRTEFDRNRSGSYGTVTCGQTGTNLTRLTDGLLNYFVYMVNDE